MKCSSYKREPRESKEFKLGSLKGVGIIYGWIGQEDTCSIASKTLLVCVIYKEDRIMEHIYIEIVQIFC